MITETTKFTLKIKDIAEILQISKTKAYEIVKSNKFPVIQEDKILRIPAKPFFEWLNGSIE